MQPVQMAIVNPAHVQVQRGEGRAPESGANGEQESSTLGRMVGHSLAMRHLFARIRCTAPHFRLATVEGEPGTGKLLLAETLHSLGPSAAGPFAPALAADFLENAAALWRQADGGLLYLARVDELSPEKQRQLREMLERAAHERIRTHVITGPLQLLAGAAQPLRRLAAEGSFRSDLASHLTAIRFALPPLRDRREDIPRLAEVLLRRWSQRHGKPMRGFSPETLNRLTGYPWPGNVLELEMAVTAAALECPGEWIRPIDLPPLQAPGLRRDRTTLEDFADLDAQPDSQVGSRSDRTAGEDPELDTNLDRTILRHIVRVLARANGNKVRAARMLGISRSTLYRLLETAMAPPAAGDSGAA